MLNTSTAYKKAVKKDRGFYIQDVYSFANGDEPDMSTSDFVAYSINEATSESGTFSIGAAVIKKYTATLNNETDKFTGRSFEGCDIISRIGLRLEDGTVEVLQKGKYRVVSAKANDLTVAVEAYDSMLFFDCPYSESTLVYPATISEIVRDACMHCQVAYDISTLPWPDYAVREKPSGDTITFRDVISYCAQVQCCFAKINHLDQLVFGWYDFDTFGAGGIDGGLFDRADTDTYITGDKVDGGSFSDYSTGDTYDAGTFGESQGYHHIYALGSQSINTDDIKVTGVRVVADQEDGEQDTGAYLYGAEWYVISIESNPLIQYGQAQNVAEFVGSRIAGKAFRPLSISCQSDPSMEAGDCIVITDRKQRSYRSVITNTTFAFGALQQITCDAETPTEKNYTKYGATTKIISAARKETNKQITAYDLAEAQLGSLMAHSMGMYETREVDPDTGAEIRYMHDKPLLLDSKTIWKQTIDAFAVSTDGGATWNGGADASGNVLANVLTAIGINADWINAGTITGVAYKDKNSTLQISDGIIRSSIASDVYLLLSQSLLSFLDYSENVDGERYSSGLNFYAKNSNGEETDLSVGLNARQMRAQKKTHTNTIGQTFLLDFVSDSLSAPEFSFDLGDVTVRDFTNVSDPKAKRNIREISGLDAQDIIKKLRPITFNWAIGKDDRDLLHFGLNADNVQQTIGKNYGTVKSVHNVKSVAYLEIIPILVSALKNVLKRLDELEEMRNGSTKQTR